MAYSLRQTPKQANTGGATAPTISFTSTPSVGDLLVIAISSSGPGSPVTSVTDNQTGNTYTQVGTTEATPSTGDQIQIFYCVVSGASGTFTLTIHFSTTSQGSTTAIFDYQNTGTIPSVALDKQAVNNGTSATPALSASITPTNANSLVFSAEVDANGDNTSISAGTNFTIEQTQLISSTAERIGTEDWIQTTATATTGGFTLGASAQWALKTAVFLPPATTTTSPVSYKTLLGAGQI